jgi:hypothetical protein
VNNFFGTHHQFLQRANIFKSSEHTKIRNKKLKSKKWKLKRKEKEKYKKKGKTYNDVLQPMPCPFSGAGRLVTLWP